MPYKDVEKQKQAQRRHYEANKSSFAKRVRDRRNHVKKWYAEYKSTLSCSCGESHYACLDFHHVDPSLKEEAINTMVRTGTTIERLKAEIAKCIVLCSNCHRKLHAKTKDSY